MISPCLYLPAILRDYKNTTVAFSITFLGGHSNSVCGRILPLYTLRTIPSVAETKGVCWTPGKPAYELNPAAAYLCSGEKFQERIIGFWDFFSLPHKWGTYRDVHGRPQGQSTVRGDIAFHPSWHPPGFNGSVSTVSGRLQRSHVPRCVRNDS